MALSYKYTLPPSGPADAGVVREMFDDVKAYLDSFVPSGGAAPIDAQYVTLAVDATLTKERVLTGTANQVAITDNGAGSTVILALPQDIANTSTPSFAGIKLRNGSGNTATINPKSSFSNYTLTMPADDGTSGQFLQTDGSGVLTWAAVTTGVTDIHGTAVQIFVSSTTGSVTLSLPQDIGTASAPQFSQMLLSGGTSAADLTLKLHDSNNGIYADGATVFEVIVNSTIAAQWDFTTFQFWNTGPIQSGSFKFRDAAGSHPTVTIVPPSGFTSYSLTLPVDDGTANQVLTTDGSGILSWTTPSGGANTALSNLASVAVNTSLLPTSDNSIDLGSSTKDWRTLYVSTSIKNGSTILATVAELGYLTGVTSAIQTQFTGKANTALSNLASVAINLSLLPTSANSIDVGATDFIWRASYAITQSAGSSGNAGTFQVFPVTSAKGSIKITAADNAGNTVTTITNASQAAARTYTIPDAGASANFVLSEGSATINGTKTFAGQLIGKGTATNDAANAGYIGEQIRSYVSDSSAVSMTGSNQYTDVTSISLTAGDWDITSICGFVANGATVLETRTGISSTSGNSGTGLNFGDNVVALGLTPNATTDVAGGIANFRVSLSGTTIYYLKAFMNYSVATPKAYGRISARRIR